MSHVLVVVSRRYNPGEFWHSLKALKRRGHTFDVVSSAYTITSEVKNTPNKLSMLIGDVTSMNKYMGILIISGNPADTELFWHHTGCLSLVEQANAQGKVVAAVCSAVPTIRYAAKGKRVSVYPLIKSQILLEDAGAILSGVSLSTDGNIITAENEQMTDMWIANVCDVLEGKRPSYVMNPSPFKRKLRTRARDPELQHLIDIERSTGKNELQSDT